MDFAFAIFCIQIQKKNPGTTLSYEEGNLLARISIDVESDFDKPRRLWVRARLGFSTLGEYAAMLPPAEDGIQKTVEVMLQWGRLRDRDHDEVPDAIDDCPDRADEDQNGDCSGSGVTPDDGGTNEVDASVMIDTRSTLDSAVAARVLDASKG